MTDLFGVSGTELLETCRLATAIAPRRVAPGLIEVFDREITKLEGDVRHELRGQVGYQAIQQIPASARCSPRCSWPRSATSRGSGPRPSWRAGRAHSEARESDLTVHRARSPNRDRVSCAGRRSRQPSAGERTKLRADFARITAHHGDSAGARKIARVAVARKIVTLVYYGLRDGTIRSKAISEAA